MAETWWIVVPSLSEQNVQATPKNAIIAEVSDTSPQYNTWLNTDSGGATYNGKTYYRRMGPFTSLAAAQKAYQTGAQTTPSPVPGIGITPGGGITTDNPFTGIADIAHAISAVAGALKGFADIITDGKMWRSLGWLILGIILMLAGVALWIGPSAARMTPIGALGRELG